MTLKLQPDQERAIEEAIRSGAFRSVDEFMDAAIAILSNAAARPSAGLARTSRLWELRKGLTLDDLSIRELIDEGRE